MPYLSNEIKRLKELKRWRNPRERRDVPPRLEMAEPLRDEHEVDLALTQDLVRDVNVTAPRIPGLWEHIERI